MTNSQDKPDPDPAPLKDADAERDTSEEAAKVPDRPTESVDDESDQDA